jgi:hypothetical protein
MGWRSMFGADIDRVKAPHHPSFTLALTAENSQGMQSAKLWSDAL